jgi:hypothetical protein
MSLVSSDISPSVTTQRQHQGNVLVVLLMVASLVKTVREKTPVGKTLTSNNVILLAGLFEHINNHDCVCDSI